MVGSVRLGSTRERRLGLRQWVARVTSLAATGVLLASLTACDSATLVAPPPVPVTYGGACNDRPISTTLVGPQGRLGDTASTVLPTDTTIDARQASWDLSTATDYPVLLREIDSTTRQGLCFVGGSITGEGISRPWLLWHKSTAMVGYGRDFTVVGTRFDNQGDGIDLEGRRATNWRIDGVEMTNIHDDCVENDEMNTGLITDSLFDGCHIAFSSVNWEGGSVPDGSDNTVTIEDTLVRLEPMADVYTGTSPGHGGFFKFSANPPVRGISPSLVIRNSVFRADQVPNYGELGMPSYVDENGVRVPYPIECENNTMVWLGSGPFPAWLPPCFEVTTDPAVWDDAAEAWRAAHAGARPGPRARAGARPRADAGSHASPGS